MALAPSHAFFRRGRFRPRARSLAYALAVAPGLVLLLATAAELGAILAARTLLDSAMYGASRLAAHGNGSAEEAIGAALEEADGLLLDAGRIELTGFGYDGPGGGGSFVLASGGSGAGLHGAGQPEADADMRGSARAPRFVLYTATHRWRTRTPLLGRLFGEDGSVGFKAHAVFRSRSR